MRVRIDRIEARFRAPVFASWGSEETRPLLTLALEADGAVGYGEAAPLEGYDGVTAEDAYTALERCRDLLERSTGRDHRRLIAACDTAAGCPPALAAIDLALWDLAGKRAGAPVWSLLGAAGASEISINATIAVDDPAAAAAEAQAARESGIGCVKVKVGAGDDAARVSAVRAAIGDAGELRLDANGAWTESQALDELATLASAGIELCEEPVSGIAATRRVAASAAVPIAIDETTEIPGALDQRLCRAASLKLSRCGGISGLIAAASRAKAVGYELYLSSTFDGPLGIAAALHAACALKPERACGLGTLALFTEDGPLAPREGVMLPPPGPGLGDGLLSFYGIRG